MSLKTDIKCTSTKTAGNKTQHVTAAICLHDAPIEVQCKKNVKILTTTQHWKIVLLYTELGSQRREQKRTQKYMHFLLYVLFC